MSEPRYLRAKSVDEAVKALAAANGDGLIVAGGVVVGSLFNQQLASPSVLVDISRIADLHGIRQRPDGGLTIGAMVTHEQVLRSPLVNASAPLLSDIAKDISCPRLRNRGTIGGSVCTVGGQGDPATGLIALGATLCVRGTSGTRTVRIAEFYTNSFQVDLRSDEVLESIEVPPLSANTTFAFCKIGPRKAMDWTQITVAVLITAKKSGAIDDIVIGMNGISTTPNRPTAVETILRRPPGKVDWSEIETTLVRDVPAQSDLIYSGEYKQHLGAVALRRAVDAAMARSSFLETT